MTEPRLHINRLIGGGGSCGKKKKKKGKGGAIHGAPGEIANQCTILSGQKGVMSWEEEKKEESSGSTGAQKLKGGLFIQGGASVVFYRL